MLKQLEQLSLEVDGRYATDAELLFLSDYVQSFQRRVQVYQQLQELEAAIVQQTYSRIRSLDPALLHYGDEDISRKWKHDTIRTLRYTAVAVLLDDSEMLRERFLLWFQTIMRSFGAQRSCNFTYQVMQEVIQEYLSPSQAGLVCPLLELNRRYLGLVS